MNGYFNGYFNQVYQNYGNVIEILIFYFWMMHLDTFFGKGPVREPRQRQESSYCALRDHEHIELDRRGAAERLHQRVASLLSKWDHRLIPSGKQPHHYGKIHHF